jgi:hypothetical protein
MAFSSTCEPLRYHKYGGDIPSIANCFVAVKIPPQIYVSAICSFRKSFCHNVEQSHHAEKFEVRAHNASILGLSVSCSQTTSKFSFPNFE